jgi:hypothetical protein
MSLVILIVVILLALGLGSVFPSRWTSSLTSDRANFETWASKAWSRMFGVPFLAAAAIFGLAYLTGAADSIRHLFADAFVLFIVFSLFLTGRGVGRVRLGIKMAFMTVFFGTVMSLLIR